MTFSQRCLLVSSLASTTCPLPSPKQDRLQALPETCKHNYTGTQLSFALLTKAMSPNQSFLEKRGERKSKKNYKIIQ